jgi:hypothetical protein
MQATRPSMRDAAALPSAGDVGNGGWFAPPRGDTAEDGPYGAYGGTCTIPAPAQSVATCHVAQNLGMAAWCHRATEYDLFCSEELDASLGCELAYIEDAPTRGFAYCCPCEGTDAATGCVNVDTSTYDRSCTRDSDCMFIWGGMSCPGGCGYVCGIGNAAINVDGQARYEQALAPVKAASVDSICHCPANFSGEPGPVCLKGVCTLPQ